jgi:hypothetical protein
MSLMPPGETKVGIFFPYFGPFGRLVIEGIIAFQIQFWLLEMKKDTYNDLSAKRVLKTN